MDNYSPLLPEEKTNIPALVLSATVHLLLIGALFLGVQWKQQVQTTVGVEVWRGAPAPMVAAPVSEPAATPKPEPKPEPKVEPKPEPKPTPKAEPKPTPKPDLAVKDDKKKKDECAEASVAKKSGDKKKDDKKPDPCKVEPKKEEPKKPEPKKEEPKKPEKPEPKKEELKKPDPRKALDDQLAKELKDIKQAGDKQKAVDNQRSRNAMQASMMAQLESEGGGSPNGNSNKGATSGKAGSPRGGDSGYADKIRNKVKGFVVLPGGIQGNPEVVFSVTQLPSGDVLNVKLVKSSGNHALDDAVERAIRKASPLPKPDNPADFQRDLKLHYHPSGD